MALYNDACSYAIDGKTDKAMESLNAAVEAGLNDTEMLASDTELDSLRDEPKFQELMKQVHEQKLVQAKEQARQMLAENQPFPFDFKALPKVEGGKVSLEDYKGKVRIVDIWGTWCPPCRMEIPHFVDLKKEYGDEGLEIIGINYERVPDEEVQSTIESYAKETGINYPLVIGDEDTRSQIPDFEGFPTTLVPRPRGQGPPEARRRPGQGGAGGHRRRAARRGQAGG